VFWPRVVATGGQLGIFLLFLDVAIDRHVATDAWPSRRNAARGGENFRRKTRGSRG
jgi:hypothetical protein